MGSSWDGVLACAGMPVLWWVCEENLIWGQVNVWSLAAIAGFLLLLQKGKLTAAGGLLGFAVAVKLCPLALMVVCTAYGWRSLLKGMAGLMVSLFVFLFFVPGLVYGFTWAWQANAYFFELAMRTAREGIGVLGWGDNCANRSVLAALYWAFGKCGSAWGRLDIESIRLIHRTIAMVLIVVTAMCGALVTARVSFRCFGKNEKNGLSNGFVLPLTIQGLLTALLVPPIAWPHHWVMLLAAMTAAAYYVKYTFKKKNAFIFACASCAAVLIWITGGAGKYLVGYMWAAAAGMLTAWVFATVCVIGEIFKTAATGSSLTNHFGE